MPESALLVGSSNGSYPVLMSCLCDFQLDVTEVDSGSETVALLGALEPALVVCDLPLPDMHASALVSQVRRHSPATSIVLVAGSSDMPRAVQVGADEYVTRPPERGQLMVSLARALKRRRTALQARRNALLDLLEESTQLVIGAAEALRRCLEAKDFSSDGHARTVGSVAGRIGRECGLPEGQTGQIELAGTLHDLGKVAVDQLILERPRGLTGSEWLEVRSHPVVGAEILASIEPLADVAVYVRHHHERHDGMGYPDRLKGEEIPLPSRIIAVADAYDAMVRPRAYRTGQGYAYAAQEFRAHAGRQWDPFVVRALLECMPELAAAG